MKTALLSNGGFHGVRVTIVTPCSVFSDQEQSKVTSLNKFNNFHHFVYDCDPLQLKFLRLRSDIAKQSITYHCLNSTAWFNQEYGNYKHSIKLKGDNGIEMHAEGTRKYTPNIVMDECKIKDGMWRKTVLEVNTSKTHRLPINDVAVYDVGDTGEEFGLEIGPVCFY
ncbi:PREDICTED: collagen alpha-1(II) chain-like [Acropora digitifera]|uniref:collagen alpha-1(II) chain-like n=1 Tax=Acropora digitifera TaxID=70779 RepID=UPI00077A8AC3|nr:PREDICTED: collagen alpha-1(II) chain-like [Acropora digitifera]